MYQSFVLKFFSFIILHIFTLTPHSNQQKSKLESLGDSPLQRAPESTQDTLFYSLLGNVCITAFKFAVYLRSGHSSMFTEAVHTLVDVANQCILAYGWREAEKMPDSKYQYGYGRAAFFYSLLTSLSTFGFGALYTFYQGVHGIMHPHPEMAADMWTASVLSASFCVDGIVLRKALINARKESKRAGMTTYQWISSFKVCEYICFMCVLCMCVLSFLSVVFFFFSGCLCFVFASSVMSFLFV